MNTKIWKTFLYVRPSSNLAWQIELVRWCRSDNSDAIVTVTGQVCLFVYFAMAVDGYYVHCRIICCIPGFCPLPVNSISLITTMKHSWTLPNTPWKGRPHCSQLRTADTDKNRDLCVFERPGQFRSMFLPKTNVLPSYPPYVQVMLSLLIVLHNWLRVHHVAGVLPGSHVYFPI